MQILDGINIVVRRGGDCVGAFGNHAGARDVAHDLGSRQVPADAGLCALPHLDFNRRARLQVILVHAEATGGHLYDGVGAVFVEVLMQAAFAGVVERSQCLRGSGQRFVCIVGDRAVAHGGEQDRHVELQLRRHVGDEIAPAIAANLIVFAAEEDAGFHRLTQGIDGGVGHLGSVDEELIPIDGISFGRAH